MVFPCPPHDQRPTQNEAAKRAHKEGLVAHVLPLNPVAPLDDRAELMLALHLSWVCSQLVGFAGVFQVPLTPRASSWKLLRNQFPKHSST